MKIYNGKNSQLSLPLSDSVRLSVGPLSVSENFMPSDDFLLMVAQTFESDEIALIVAGPFEINLCAKNPACTPLIVQSLDEAIERFGDKKEKESDN